MTQQAIQNEHIKWGEFIPLLIGRYSVCTTEDSNGNSAPALYDSREEVELEIQESIDAYHEEIASGEREPDDEYEGLVFPCVLSGDEIILLCEETYEEIERVNWKETL